MNDAIIVAITVFSGIALVIIWIIVNEKQASKRQKRWRQNLDANTKAWYEYKGSDEPVIILERQGPDSYRIRDLYGNEYQVLPEQLYPFEE